MNKKTNTTLIIGIAIIVYCDLAVAKCGVAPYIATVGRLNYRRDTACCV